MAAGDILTKYGSAVEITWGSSIASTSAATDTALSNAVTITGQTVTDLLISLKTTTASGTLGSSNEVRIFAAASRDGTNYPVAASGFLRFVGGHKMQAAATTEYSNMFSLAAAFGGTLPPYCKFLLYNDTGLALAAGADDTELYYVPTYGFVTLS